MPSSQLPVSLHAHILTGPLETTSGRTEEGTGDTYDESDPAEESPFPALQLPPLNLGSPSAVELPELQGILDRSRAGDSGSGSGSGTIVPRRTTSAPSSSRMQPAYPPQIAPYDDRETNLPAIATLFSHLELAPDTPTSYDTRGGSQRASSAGSAQFQIVGPPSAPSSIHHGYGQHVNPTHVATSSGAHRSQIRANTLPLSHTYTRTHPSWSLSEGEAGPSSGLPRRHISVETTYDTGPNIRQRTGLLSRIDPREQDMESDPPREFGRSAQYSTRSFQHAELDPNLPTPPPYPYIPPWSEGGLRVPTIGSSHDSGDDIGPSSSTVHAASQTPGTTDFSVSGDEPMPRRRKGKVAVACDLCRKRKHKCDGKRPTCGYCAHLGLTCKYVEALKRRGKGKAPKGQRSNKANAEARRSTSRPTQYDPEGSDEGYEGLEAMFGAEGRGPTDIIMEPAETQRQSQEPFRNTTASDMAAQHGEGSSGPRRRVHGRWRNEKEDDED